MSTAPADRHGTQGPPFLQSPPSVSSFGSRLPLVCPQPRRGGKAQSQATPGRALVPPPPRRATRTFPRLPVTSQVHSQLRPRCPRGARAHARPPSPSPPPCAVRFPRQRAGGRGGGRDGSRKQLLQFLSRKDHPRPSFPGLKEKKYCLCVAMETLVTQRFFPFSFPPAKSKNISKGVQRTFLGSFSCVWLFGRARSGSLRLQVGGGWCAPTAPDSGSHPLVTCHIPRHRRGRPGGRPLCALHSCPRGSPAPASTSPSWVWPVTSGPSGPPHR